MQFLSTVYLQNPANESDVAISKRSRALTLLLIIEPTPSTTRIDRDRTLICPPSRNTTASFRTPHYWASVLAVTQYGASRKEWRI